MSSRIITIILAIVFAAPVWGMPRVVLNPNRPLQQQLSKPNTRYVIKKPIDLQSSTITIPAGSTLEFKCKGIIHNGTICGNETKIKKPKLQRIRFAGSFINDAITVNDDIDVETDFWSFIECFPKADVTLTKDIALSDTQVKDMNVNRFHINGKGHVIKVQRCPILRNVDVKLENVTFECTDASEHVIYAIGGQGRHFAARKCSFVNVPEVTSLCSRAYDDVLIEQCFISGLLKPSSRRSTEFNTQILVYACSGRVIIRDNAIKDCYGGAIKGIGFKADEHSCVLVENNTVDNVSNGGIVFAGGEVWNITIINNKISQTHSLGKQFDKELDGAINSAINIHGFHNALVENNIIENCPKSSSLDFDGSVAGESSVAKGTGLVVRNNHISHSGPVAIFVVQDAEFRGNTIHNDSDYDSQNIVSISGSSNLHIEGNTFHLNKGKARSFYPIYLTDSKYVHSGQIRIEGNSIETNGEHFIFVNHDFTGDCQISDNSVNASGRKDGNLNIINNSKTKVAITSKSKLIRYR